MCETGHRGSSGRSRQRLGRKGPRSLRRPGGRQPQRSAQAPREDPGSALPPSGQPQCPPPRPRPPSPALGPAHPCAHSSPLTPLHREEWGDAPGGSDRRLRRDAVSDEDAEEGCASRRFAAAAGAGRGRGRAPDRGCCCRGDAGWGRGPRSLTPARTPPTLVPRRVAPPRRAHAAHTRRHARHTRTAARCRRRALGLRTRRLARRQDPGQADLLSCPLRTSGLGEQWVWSPPSQRSPAVSVPWASRPLSVSAAPSTCAVPRAVG